MSKTPFHMMKKYIIPFLLLAIVFSTGCGKEKIDPSGQHYEDVVAVHLYPWPNEVYLNPGQTFKISWSVSPDNGYVNDTWWVTLKSGVISVDDNGLVTALGVGDDQVFMRVLPSNMGARYYFHVVQTPVPLTGLSLSPSSLELAKGSSGWLELNLTPSNTTERNLVWSSDDESVAVVDETGKITGKGAGTATITAEETTSGKRASATVVVKVPFSSIKVDYPGSKHFHVEEHDGQSCFAIEANKLYTIACTTKPSTAEDDLLYKVQEGKEDMLTISSSGAMAGLKYGGPVMVTVRSRMVESVKASFYVFIYDQRFVLEESSLMMRIRSLVTVYTSGIYKAVRRLMCLHITHAAAGKMGS